MFLVHLHKQRLRATTIRTYLTAISFVHRIKNMPDPSHSLLITKTLHGIANLDKLRPSTPLRPITRDILHKLIDAIPAIQPFPYYQALLKALFLLTYHACMRAGEAVVSMHDQHTLSLSDIESTTYNQLPAYNITFRTYKHSHNPAILTLLPASTPQYCPVQSLKEYLRIRGQTPGKLFISCTRQPINRHFFADNLKSALGQLGLPSNQYNTHSFRIGRATQMALEHTPDSVIRTVGRWHSSAYQGYIRPTAIDLPQ